MKHPEPVRLVNVELANRHGWEPCATIRTVEAAPTMLVNRVELWLSAHGHYACLSAYCDSELCGEVFGIDAEDMDELCRLWLAERAGEP